MKLSCMKILQNAVIKQSILQMFLTLEYLQKIEIKKLQYVLYAY